MDDRALALIFFCVAAMSGFVALIERGTYRFIWLMIALTWAGSAFVWRPWPPTEE